MNISTKELFDEYYQTMPEERARKTRAQADRQEVYEYEEKLGKQLIEMSAEELIGLMLTLRNTSKNNPNGSLSFGSYDAIITNYRAIWNYYIDNYEVIKNPWYDKRLRGMEIAKKIAEVRKPFTKELFEKEIELLHERYHKKKANYDELLMRLFYEGVYQASDISRLREQDIDIRNKAILISGRKLKLSDRCFELLIEVKTYVSMPNHRGELFFTPYHDRYLPYIIREKEIENFDERQEYETMNMINRRIIMDVNKFSKYNVNYKNLYLLGFYDALVDKFGKDRAQELILSERNAEDTKDLLDFAYMKDCPVNNVTLLKRSLRQFLE